MLQNPAVIINLPYVSGFDWDGMLSFIVPRFLEWNPSWTTITNDHFALATVADGSSPQIDQSGILCT